LPLFFQWLKNGTNLADGETPSGSVISGSGTGTLAIANLAQADAGTYAILVTNAIGSATNAGTALTVSPVTAPGNTLSSLYSFTDLNDGALPNGLALGANGIIYGTAEGGGISGAGTIFALAGNGAPVGLYDFTGGSDGAFPLAPLLPAADGNFYGSANEGGVFNGGTLFSFTTNANFTNLYAFTTGSDGAFPEAQLTPANDGFFYGTTYGGGTNNFGTVFKVSPGGVFSNLYSFSGADDGGQPQSPLVRGLDGNFYGATDSGGANGFGTIFRISTNGVLTNIYTFSGIADGAQPVGLIPRPDGSFYGVTFTGGSNNNGVIFRLTPGGAFTTLFTFGALTNSTNANGANPVAGLIPASDGNLYGSAVNGGIFGDGTIFKLAPSGAFTTLAWFDGFNGAHPEAPMVYQLAVTIGILQSPFSPSPLNGDHGARSARLLWGNQIVAGLGSHWVGVRGENLRYLPIISGKWYEVFRRANVRAMADAQRPLLNQKAKRMEMLGIAVLKGAAQLFQMRGGIRRDAHIAGHHWFAGFQRLEAEAELEQFLEDQ
jgi:uncharacterized repeat protein (TIGR03803 family)